MNSVIGALRVVLGMDSVAFEKGLGEAQKRLGKFEKDMGRLSKKLDAIGQTLTVGLTLPILAFGAASIQAAGESADAMGQVEAALASMGGASGRTAKQLEESASKLQKLTAIDDDAILRDVTANLLTFGRVSGPIFDRAQVAILDMATRLKMDLKSATVLVGKALQDPVKGIAALGRSGIQFSASQKAMIKSLVETGRYSDATSIILGELEKQFQGSAKAAADASPYGRMQVAIGELGEAVGQKLLPHIVPAIASITDLINAFSELPAPVQTAVVGLAAAAAVTGPLISGFGMATGMVAKMGPYLLSVATAAGTMSAANIRLAFTTSALGAAFSGAGTGMALFKGSGAAVGVVMTGLGRTMLALVGGPIGLLIGSVALATAGITLLMRANSDAAIAADADRRSHERLDPIINTITESMRAAASSSGALRNAHMEAARAAFILGEREIESAKKSLAAARARVAASKQTDAALMKSGIGGMPGYMTGLAELEAKKREAELKAAEDRLIDAGIGRRRGSRGNGTTFNIIDPNEMLEQTLAADRAAASVASVGDAGDAAGKKAKEAQAALEAWRREQARLTTELEAARMVGDTDKVRSLEQEIDKRERIKDYQENGLTLAAATVAAERDLKVLGEARAKAQQVELDAHADDVALQVAEISGETRIVSLLQRKAEKAQLIAFYQEQGKTAAEAQVLAEADLLKIETARVAQREKLRKEAQLEFELELARARGDSEASLRRREQELEVGRRARDIQDRDGVSEADARKQAEAEVAALEDARLEGVFRQTFRDGVMAALDGDLKSFAKDWIRDWASKGLEEALNSLSDILWKVFQQIVDSQPASGGIISNLASMFGSGGSGPPKLPGFRNGGSFRVGGVGGVDSQVVSFRATPNEIVDVRTANDNGGRGGAVKVIVEANEYFDARVERISSDVSAKGDAEVIGGSMADRQRSAMKQQYRARR
jgi:hypothetical protein